MSTIYTPTINPNEDQINRTIRGVKRWLDQHQKPTCKPKSLPRREDRCDFLSEWNNVLSRFFDAFLRFRPRPGCAGTTWSSLITIYELWGLWRIVQVGHRKWQPVDQWLSTQEPRGFGPRCAWDIIEFGSFHSVGIDHNILFACGFLCFDLSGMRSLAGSPTFINGNAVYIFPFYAYCSRLLYGMEPVSCLGLFCPSAIAHWVPISLSVSSDTVWYHIFQHRIRLIYFILLFELKHN